MTIRQDIHDEIDAERDRQDAKFGWIGSPTSILPGDDEYAKLAVLGEEYGEVSRELLESAFAGVQGTTPHLEEELVQCAAVCVAWVEAIREKRGTAAMQGRCVHYGIEVGGTPVRWRVLSQEHGRNGIVTLIRNETKAMPDVRRVVARDITAWDVE